MSRLSNLLRKVWADMVVWGSFVLFVLVEVELIYRVYRWLGVW